MVLEPLQLLEGVAVGVLVVQPYHNPQGHQALPVLLKVVEEGTPVRVSVGGGNHLIIFSLKKNYKKVEYSNNYFTNKLLLIYYY